MLVFAKENLVFLALPKTGTTALETALEPHAAVVLRKMPNLKHTPGYRYDKYLRTYLAKCGLKNLEALCVLRHPVGWLGSWYRYRARPAKAGAKDSTADMTFDAFVADYISDDPSPVSRVGYPPRFIRDNDGTVVCDHLFQYEQMPKLIAFLEDRLRTRIDLPLRNVSPAGDLTLSPDLERGLEARFPQMFEDWSAAAR